MTTEFSKKMVGWMVKQAARSPSSLAQLKCHDKLVDMLVNQNDASENAQKGGKKKHEDSIVMKAEIVARFIIEKQKYPTKDKAAEAYTKYYALEFSTIRKYLKNL